MTLMESCPSNNTWISRTWTVTTFTKLELPVTCKIESAKFNCSAMSLLSSETKEVQFPHHRMKILEQHWDEEANNFNETKFYRSNVTVKPTISKFPSLKTDYSNLKIPLISIGGVTAFILLASIGIRLTACKKTENPTGAVNFNINNTNSANNENNAANSANNDIEEAPPAPVAAPPSRTLDEILDMKACERSEAEKRLVLEHRWEQKEQEASTQKPGAEEPVKIWKLLDKKDSSRTSCERLAVNEWKKKQDPFQM